MASLTVDWIDLSWRIGRRVPRRVADIFARLTAPVASLFPLPKVDAWAESVTAATGTPPTRRQRRRLIEHWIRNNLWSLSLADWGPNEILKVARPTPGSVERMRDSLSGPGLILALPHMGSWDFAGTWCAVLDMPVVSVAERLGAGLYERFSEARAQMGMKIYPVDQPDVLRSLANDVKDGRLICLLADRDLSSHGIQVPWPGTAETISVPAGPALLARRTGADLRVATLWFDGKHLRIHISDRVEGDSPRSLMAGVVTKFAAGVRRHPESWLMLRKAFR